MIIHGTGVMFHSFLSLSHFNKLIDSACGWLASLQSAVGLSPSFACLRATLLPSATPPKVRERTIPLCKACSGAKKAAIR